MIYYSEMGQGCVNWLSYSVVLQLFLSPNQCEIPKFQDRTNELCDPCTVLFVLFIDFTIQRCWKTVLISSINISFYYLSPLPLYFVLCFIRFHADKLHLFLFKAFILFLKKSPILSMRTMTDDHSQQPSSLRMQFEESLLHFFHYIVQHYYISHVLHALIRHKTNALHIGYGLKAMTDDG